MLFNSFEFILLFVPITVTVFYVIRRRSYDLAMLFLLAASAFFYGWWNPSFLTLILASVGVNYVLGTAMYRARLLGKTHQVKGILIAGLAVNLALLGYFKYFNFFTDNVSRLLDLGWTFERIVLPLGISFFTFQQITFLVDLSKGKIGEVNFPKYFLFIVFFPHLIAGPIVYYTQMVPQFIRNERRHKMCADVAVGLAIFTIGLFKKVVFADGVSIYATPAFTAAADGIALTFVAAWGAALAYTLQLYFDFSGYSDMAIGLARMFGVRLPMNFNSPYKSCSIIDFWRRWHMTLSHFLRDYIYIPLGGNRRGHLSKYFNILVTVLLGGLWHGAGWTYVAWGALHGIFLVVNHAWRSAREKLAWLPRFPSRAGKVLGWALTFLVVVIAWVFFRAADVLTALSILKAMAGLNGFSLPKEYLQDLGPLAPVLQQWGWRFDGAPFWNGRIQMTWVLLLFVVALTFPNTQTIMRRYRPTLDYIAVAERTGKGSPAVESGKFSWVERVWRVFEWHADTRSLAWTVGLALAALLYLFGGNDSEFLYFQF